MTPSAPSLSLPKIAAHPALPSCICWLSALSLTTHRSQRHSNPATAGWRRFRQNGDWFCKVRIVPLPLPFLFLREGLRLGKSSSDEKYGRPLEPVPESEANRSQ